MRNQLHTMIIRNSAFFLLVILLLYGRGEAITSPSHLTPCTLTYWWEIPYQPPEKWLSPRREDDEWYKRRHKQKYRKAE